MQQIVLDAEVSEIPAELGRRGIAAHTRVHVTVEVADEVPPMARLAQAGKAFDWLAEEPDLYADADLVERAG
jgi:hypothetical protein